MRTPRFYVPPGPLSPDAMGSEVTLPAAAAHHATRVLKLRDGDALVLFDGSGGEYRAALRREGSVVRAVLREHIAAARESPCRIVLVLALARSHRMDYAIQKTTELGVAEIVPVATERSVVKLDGSRARHRLDHWQEIAVAACEQSGRTTVPTIHAPLDLPRLLAELAPAGRQVDPQIYRIYLDPRGQTLAVGARRQAPAVTVAVGPEGGFTGAEETGLTAAGFTPVRLGPRTLRAETAAAAAVLAAQILWGDMGA